MERKKIVLCGSSLYKPQFEDAKLKLSLLGHKVYGLATYSKHDKIPLTDTQIDILKHLHKTKISECDEVYIIVVNSRIGISTRSEIEYAKLLSKKIRYLRYEC